MLVFWSYCAGESLQDERVQGGAFVSPDGLQMPYKHVPVRHYFLYMNEMMDGLKYIWSYQMSSLALPVIIH